MAHGHYLSFTLDPSPFEKGWRGVEVTSRSDVSGCTMLQPRTDGGELKRNHEHIKMCPVDNSPAACEQPNTIGTGRQASCSEQPAATADPCARPESAARISWTTITHRILYSLWLSSAPSSKVFRVLSCSTSKTLGVNQYCAEYVCVVKACECDHSDGCFHFILIIVLCTCVNMQKQELMKIS